jgi:hypothetical protein
MRIGVMTFWWSEDNYGQLLQCYALQKYLRNAGHDAYIIRYNSCNDYIKSPLWRNIIKAFNPVKLYKYLLSKKQKKNELLEKRNSPRGFENFRNKYIIQSEKIYYTYKELAENPPEADIYIVGSDQVWNTFGAPIDIVINPIKAYLLDFGDPSIKHIAYAASFGNEMIDDDSIRLFTPLLKKFNYISVREKSGINICKKCGIDNAEWVPDPTMLLDADLYRSIYKNELIKKTDKPYCFLYYLGNKCDFSIQSIYDWAKSKNIEVIYVKGNSNNDKFKKIYMTIPEWIYLLEHSEYVITNSFHCSVFSLLFQKKFCVIPREGKEKGMNSRFNSLFELLQIDERFIDSDFSVLDKDINWQSVSSCFQRIRNNCKLSYVI